MAETWTYYDANTIQVAGDLTAKYWANQLAKITQGGAVKFFIIAAVALVSGNTRLSINGCGVFVLTNETITSPAMTTNAAAPAVPYGFGQLRPNQHGDVGIGAPTKLVARLVVKKNTGYIYDETTIAALFGNESGADCVFVTGNTVNGCFGVDSDDLDLWLNYRGYNGGVTRYRSLSIGNGKGNLILRAVGSLGNIDIGGSTAPLAKLCVNGGVNIGGVADPGDNNLAVAGNIGAGGITGPTAHLHIPENGTIFFADNGSISSADAYHRIFFDRANNALEFIEWGKIYFSPDAYNGARSISFSGQGNAHFGGTVTASAYVDDTPAFTGDALAEIKKISHTHDKKIDHSTLPKFAQFPHRVKNGKERIGRDIGGMVSILTVAVQQLIAENEALKARVKLLEG